MKNLLIIFIVYSFCNDSFAQHLVEIPFDLSVEKLDSLKLKEGNIHYMPDKYINKIIAFSHNGKELKKGDKIQQGSKIDLMVGNGLTTNICVPYVVGLTEEEADKILKKLKLRIGTATRQSSTIENKKIIKQYPLPYKTNTKDRNRIREGSKVDIWVE